MMRKTYKIALGGMLAALSLVLMLFTMLVPVGELVFPALAGILLISAVYEIGEGWALLIFAAVSILSLLMPSSKDAAVYYIFFLGHYPVVKSFVERVKFKPLKWAIKLIVFNACAFAAFFVIIKISGMPDDIQHYGYAAAAAVLNVTFVIYDIAVSRLVVLYNSRIRRIFKKF